MNFNKFAEALRQQFLRMKGHTLYKVDVSKDDMWNKYLSSFPSGTNPIYRERTVHDCQCCKQFIHRMGNVVCYIDGKRMSIWDAAPYLGDVDPAFVIVAYNMSCLLDDAPIREPFFHYEDQVGVAENHGQTADGEIETWNHFHVRLPAAVVVPKGDISRRIGTARTTKDVFKRALNEITLEAVNIVLELIEQKSLYRGEEHKNTLEKFKKCVQDFIVVEGTASLVPNIDLEYWFWTRSHKEMTAVSRIRNTSIGVLLVDLSEGDKGLDGSVSAFEAMVAPANYKRPTALITKSMIKKAEETVIELGFLEALQRRHACIEDIKVTNVLYVSRGVKSVLAGNPFDELADDLGVNPQTLKKVEEIQIEDFVKDILPNISTLEVLMENRHEDNLMSLVAPADPDSKNMLKWGNNFTWTYNGDIADSMKQRVKAAGGKVDGVIRFSIQWNEGSEHNRCDYDAHCNEPDGNTIYYGNPRSSTGGDLDVDIINPIAGKPAVENITWPNESSMLTGTYNFRVHAYSARSGNNGFTAELEYNGECRSYVYNKRIPQQKFVEVAEVTFIPHKGMIIVKELPATTATREVWGVKTMQFHPVSFLMNSPNHWDGEKTGNKHFFFMMEKCRQEGTIRGFYNEFLTNDLTEHRKVFEMLGSKMKVPESETQLSGLGFSSTQRNHVYARVTGSFTRTLKIMF